MEVSFALGNERINGIVVFFVHLMDSLEHLFTCSQGVFNRLWCIAPSNAVAFLFGPYVIRPCFSIFKHDDRDAAAHGGDETVRGVCIVAIAIFLLIEDFCNLVFGKFVDDGSVKLLGQVRAVASFVHDVAATGAFVKICLFPHVFV